MAMPTPKDIPEVPPFAFFISGGTLKEPLIVLDPKTVVQKLKDLKQHHEPPGSKPIVGVMVRVLAPNKLEALIDQTVDEIMKRNPPPMENYNNRGEAREALRKVTAEVLRAAIYGNGEGEDMLKALAESTPSDAQVHFMNEKGELGLPGMKIKRTSLTGVVELERSRYTNWPG